MHMYLHVQYKYIRVSMYARRYSNEALLVNQFIVPGCPPSSEYPWTRGPVDPWTPSIRRPNMTQSVCLPDLRPNEAHCDASLATRDNRLQKLDLDQVD
jgi:hypothetical protein